MANTYSWTIQRLYYDLGPDAEGHSDIVTSVDWLVTASDGEDPPHEALYSRTTHLVWEEGDPWIPYADLTQATVQSWVEEDLGEDGVEALEASLAANIAEQVTPTHETMRGDELPWNEGDGD